MLDQNQPLLRFTLLSAYLSAPLVLATDPIGWEDMGVKLHRDGKYHGLATEYTVELGFVKDGRSALVQLLETDGVDQDLELLVEVFDANEFEWDIYYRGRLDLSGSSQTATEFRCTAEKTGFTQRLLAREDSTVDLFGSQSVGGVALPAFEPVVVELHSKAIRKRYSAVAAATPLPPFPDYVTDGESRFKVMYFGLDKIDLDEFDVQETGAGTVTVATGDNAPEIPVYRTKESGNFRVELRTIADLTITRQDGQGDFDRVEGQIFFRFGTEAPQLLTSWQATGIAGDYLKRISVTHTASADLPIGGEIYYYGRLHVSDISGNVLGQYNFPVSVQMLPGSYFRLEADTQTDPTTAAGLLTHEALQRLAQACTDETDCFRSDFYGRTDSQPAYAADGEGSLVLVTGGFQVRGFPLPSDPAPVAGQPDPRKSLHTTWQGAMDGLNTAHWIGYGIERGESGQELVRVEPAGYFYSDEVVLELVEPVTAVLPDSDGTPTSNLVRKELPDRYFNKARLGWQKWQTQQANGLDEFNAVREWALPLRTTGGSYEVLGSYITSGFYLESTRRQRYEKTASQDDQADTDLFLICLLRDPDAGFRTERNENFPDLAGVFSPETVYNVRFSPARLLRRHGPALAAGLRYQQGEYLRMSFGEGNNELLSRLTTETTAVLESAPVPVPDLGTPLWQPVSWSFTAPCSRAQAAAILANPRGRVRFRDTRNQWQEGWILDFSHTLVRSEADFTLLRCHTLTI